MIHLLLLAQLASSAPDTVREGGDVYASEAVRATVAQAAALNRRVPAALRAYRATVETEVAVVLRLPGGFERTVQLEQIASDVRWRRPGDFAQRIVGYRAQSSGVSFSSLSWFRSAWAVPHLYGNRLVLFFGRDTTRQRRARGDSTASDSTPSDSVPRGADAADQGTRTMTAIHPLADDRGRVYRFSGGDTVVVVRLEGREIPIVRVKVEPRVVPGRRTLLFRGELDLDATRHELVRMRGQFMAAGGRRTLRQRLATRAMQAVLYMELVNREVEGRYWLPAYQRIEAQGTSVFGGESRAVARVLTRFGRIATNDTVLPADSALLASLDSSAAALDTSARDSSASDGGAVASGAVGDSLLPRPHVLTIAPADSLSSFSAWRAPLGEGTADARADDFDDIAPDAWRPTGRPRLDFRPERSSDIVRFNRVEGAFTGVVTRMRFRDAAPGLVVGGSAGWAWSERAVRGSAGASLDRGRTRWELSAGRTLVSTTDFLEPFDDGLGLEGLLGSADLSDFHDRRFASLAVVRTLGKSGATLRLEGGPGSDRAVFRSLDRGLVGGERLPLVRHAEEGDYVRGAVVLDLNPAAGLVRPGTGLRLSYERGDGELRWQRIEARLTNRRHAGPITLDARADAGVAILHDTLPQQLFELGGREGLTGYDAKSFGGDRAAVARGTVLYTTPWLRAPVRVGPARWRLWLPGVTPGFAASVHTGWTDASDGVARAALARLGRTTDPATRRAIADPEGELEAPVATDGLRTSVELTARFFGGSVALGAARPVDRRGTWRFVFRLGDEM